MAAVEIRNYGDLIRALRCRQHHLNISLHTLDQIAGLPLGYCAKILGPGQVKHLGPISFQSLLGALGCRLALVEDPEAMARIRSRLIPRTFKQRPLDGYLVEPETPAPAPSPKPVVDRAAQREFRTRQYYADPAP
jgi:hypothetical protein